MSYRTTCAGKDARGRRIEIGGTIHNRRASGNSYAKAAVVRRRALADSATSHDVYPIAGVVVHAAMVDDPALPEAYACRGAGRHVNKRDSAAVRHPINANRETLNGPVLDRQI